MSRDEIILEFWLSNCMTVKFSHRYYSTVSSPLQQVSCTPRVSQSKGSAVALLAFWLSLRFHTGRLIGDLFWRRDVNWLPGDWIIKAGCWVGLVVRACKRRKRKKGTCKYQGT